MLRIAIKMLQGDRAKYYGLIFGIAFATLLMSQQVSIFVSLLGRTASQINDITEASVWVMDPQTQYIEETKAMPARDLQRVRGVTGVEWAVPLFKGMAVVRAGEGILNQVIVMGVDDASLIGRPPRMILGSWEDIRQPNAMIMDRAGFEFIWPGEKMELGREIEINDRRIRIVGICDSTPPFVTFPVTFMRYSEATKIVPTERNAMSFILVKPREGISPKEAATRIHEETGLQALTKPEFMQRSITYVLTRTGIPINFGITIVLGFVIGAAVAGQTFFIFVIENLKQFGALKAIGVTNAQILTMVLAQAAIVAFIGYAIGIGLTTSFFEATKDVTALRGFFMPWQVAAGTAVAIVFIILIASLASIRKVMVLDPAIVFRG